MKRVWFIALLAALTALSAVAQTAPTAEISRLQARMYKLYSTQDYDLFMSVTDSLKDACLRAGDERTFYRAWGNQALYAANHQRRNLGYQMAQELQTYALQRQSKFGIYNGTHISAYILGQMGSLEEAKSMFREAIDYLHAYLPGESAASSLLELSKLEYQEGEMQKVIDYAQQVLKEPKLNPLHRLNALSMQCLAVADTVFYKHLDYAQRFEHYYAERKKAKEAYGRDDSYGLRVDIWHSIINNDFDEAIRLSEKMPSLLARLESQRFIYRQKGDYKNAYNAEWRYRNMRNTIDGERNAHLLAEMSTAMNVGRLESEAKDLKLKNQALELEQIAADLEQQRLAEEALNLTLQNQQAELRNASIQMRNDSLDKYNQALQLSEYKSKMEAQANAARARRIFTVAVVMLAALIIAALAFFLWRRSVNMRRLSRMNSQLRDANDNLKQAYDKLEETTKAKERIESELRIARGIQMDMVPRIFPAFPEREDIDIYASIESAKEVGGDLYDFFLQNEKLYFCIGDVSGKGIPASLFMSVVVNVFRMVAKEGFPPAYIATKLNDALSAENENGMFCTMFIGEIDLNTGRMNFCNAGHNPPLFINRPLAPHEPCRPEFIEMEANAPIGLWPELEYVGESVSNVRGRTLFLYTDGLTEAENLLQEQFGEERLIQIFNTSPFKDCRQTVDIVKTSVIAFVGEAEPSDDLTMLCIKIK